MDLRKIAAEAIAEDASFFDGVKRFFRDDPPVSLAAHDRRFHPHGFNPKRDTCKFRENLGKGDDYDAAVGKTVKGGGGKTAESEHSYRVTPDGKRVPANAAFRKALESYDKDHRIYAVSDTHSTGLDDLDIEDSGIVILGGDFIMRSSEKAAKNEGYASVSIADSASETRRWIEDEFLPWIASHPDKQFVIIPGNHDKYFEYKHDPIEWPANAHFLVDEPVEVNGLRMYGTPWCYYNMNGAYEVGHDELKEHFSKIPEGLDVLITHTPPKMDGLDIDLGKEHYGHFGSPELTDAILEKKPKLVLCGHVHTGDHKPVKIGDSTVVNVARVGSARHSPGYAGRQMAFDKDGDKTADFLVDKEDGQQIDVSAYPEEGSRIKGIVGIRNGKISPESAFSVLAGAERAVNRAIDDKHFCPAANPIGEYDFAKPYIEKLAKSDKDGKEMKEAIEAIEASRKSGWKKSVPKVKDPYAYSPYLSGFYYDDPPSYGGGKSYYDDSPSYGGRKSYYSGGYQVHNPKPMYWGGGNLGGVWGNSLRSGNYKHYGESSSPRPADPPDDLTDGDMSIEEILSTIM